MGLTSHVDRVPELVAAFEPLPRAHARSGGLFVFRRALAPKHNRSGDSIMKLLRSRKTLFAILVAALLIALAGPAEATRAPKYSWTPGGATYGDPDPGNGGFHGDPDIGGGGLDQGDPDVGNIRGGLRNTLMVRSRHLFRLWLGILNQL